MPRREKRADGSRNADQSEDDKSEACTVYAPEYEPQVVARIAMEWFPDALPKAPPLDWTKIKIASSKGTLQLSSTVYREPGDEASVLCLKTWNHFRYVRNRSPAEEAVFRSLLHVRWFIGVMAPIGFNQHTLDFVTAITKAVRAIVFNGTNFVDADGRTVLRGPTAEEREGPLP